MDEESLCNTVAVCGDQPNGGFILLERVDRNRWQAYEWSAFFVRMVLSTGSCRSFLDATGQAITELYACDIMQLCDRLEVRADYTEERMVFMVPTRLLIAEQIYARWKNDLPTEPKIE